MHLTEDLNDNLISRAIYALARIDFITALKLFARSIRAKFATYVATFARMDRGENGGEIKVLAAARNFILTFRMTGPS